MSQTQFFNLHHIPINVIIRIIDTMFGSSTHWSFGVISSQLARMDTCITLDNFRKSSQNIFFEMNIKPIVNQTYVSSFTFLSVVLLF